MNGIGDTLRQITDPILSFLPKLLGFLVILLIGYIIARVVKTLVVKAADHFKVDQTLTDSQAGGVIERVSPGGKPSRIVGGVAFWFIFLFALTAALGVLEIPTVTAFMTQILAYLPNIIAAVLIFVIAAAVSGVVAAAIAKTMGDTPTGKLVGSIVPALVMVIAVFMILTQLGIAPQIVLVTYSALLGMLALAGALAFGLGGRDLAAHMLNQAYDKGQEQSEQVKADARQGRQRGQEQAQQARSRATGDDQQQAVAGGQQQQGGSGTGAETSRIRRR